MKMPAKKKASRRPRAASPAREAKSRLEKTWKDTQAALVSAEAKVEKRVKTWSQSLERERKKALKQVEGRLVVLQTRAKKERRAVARMVDDAVQRTLAALNIPSRQEVQELTRRVEELSGRIDRFRR
jgi:polyhydroxyalkanoate synthesis regulator phasin